MDNLIERGLLYDFYGDLLTDHQQKIYSAVVFDDLSLGEISEEEGISRQGIYDLIKRCDRILSGYEEKLKLIERFKAIKVKISAIDGLVEGEKTIPAAVKDRIKSELKEIVREL
jgi:predicted DNA-binding protein YlxM (UPF0122 family)